jgi:CHAT domain-containing protein/predicted negative regulator of RcsB-dependent stress response
MDRNDGIPLIPQQGLSGTPSSVSASYWFSLHSGEYFTLSLQKTSTGLMLSVFRPDGKLLRSVGCSHDGQLGLSEIASLPGRYVARLNSCLSTGFASYEISLSHPIVPTASQILRVEAERLMSEAELLNNNYRADSRRAAIAKYEEALMKWSLLKDPIKEAAARGNLAELYRDVGDLSFALQVVQAALTADQYDGGSLVRAQTYLTLATILLIKGDITGAMEACNRGLEIAKDHFDRKLEAQALYILGRIRYDAGNYVQAAKSLNEAEQISRERGDGLGAALATFYLGAVDFDLRRFDVARNKFLQTLTVFRAFGKKEAEARALTFLGHAYSELNQKQEALNFYEKSIELVTPARDFSTEASLLNGIARVHFQLGDIKVATQFFQLALERSRSQGNPIEIAAALRSIGECYLADGDRVNALRSLREALSTFRSISHKLMQAVVLHDIGIVLLADGDRSGAIANFNASLGISRSIGHRQIQGWNLTALGQMRETAGESASALEYYAQALHLYESIEDRNRKLAVLYRIAKCLRLTGNLEKALVTSRTAVAEIEALRTGVENRELRTSYFASVREQYELFIDVQMQLYRGKHQTAFAVSGFETSEASRARMLLENIAETRSSISTGLDPKLVERDATLRALLESKTDYYTQLLAANGDRGSIAEVGAEIRTLTAESSQVEAQLRSQSPQYAALIRPKPLKLAQIQHELLDENSLLLEYAIGEENSYLWAVTNTDFASFVLPKGSELEKKIREVRELMTANMALPAENFSDFQARVKKAAARYPQATAELSDILLGPVANQLTKHRLVIVAEGPLQYLPFAALPEPRRRDRLPATPLVLNHEIVKVPSASTVAVIRDEKKLRTAPDRTIAVFADPVFQASDQRVRRPPFSAAPSRAASSVVSTSNITLVPAFRGEDGIGITLDLARLPATRREAEAILSMVPQNGRLAAVGFGATKSMAMSPELKRYRIVHFATHTILNDEHPDLSSLVLSLVDEHGNSQNGFLRLRDMYNLSLSAELVVLSACDTALGKEIKGEGLMSMVRGFMYSGSPRVLASLWKVDDEATAELMKEFYKQLFENKLTPAAALRQAQITQLQRTARQSPYFWAGFELQGEWK